ncbi:MAG: hypothetical protein ACRDT0_01200 [Pseudonocardiaceae bacterium]
MTPRSRLESTRHPHQPPRPAAGVRAAAVVAAIASHRFCYRAETQLQHGIAAALAAAGLPVRREVALSRTDRVDILVETVAVEVKVAGSATTVLRQLQRYAAHDLVCELVLVTTRAAHRALVPVVGGKPLHLLGIGGAA